VVKPVAASGKDGDHRLLPGAGGHAKPRRCSAPWGRATARAWWTPAC